MILVVKKEVHLITIHIIMMYHVVVTPAFVRFPVLCVENADDGVLLSFNGR
jgi:hypothetical protein